MYGNSISTRAKVRYRKESRVLVQVMLRNWDSIQWPGKYLQRKNCITEGGSRKEDMSDQGQP